MVWRASVRIALGVAVVGEKSASCGASAGIALGVGLGASSSSIPAKIAAPSWKAAELASPRAKPTDCSRTKPDSRRTTPTKPDSRRPTRTKPDSRRSPSSSAILARRFASDGRADGTKKAIRSHLRVFWVPWQGSWVFIWGFMIPKSITLAHVNSESVPGIHMCQSMRVRNPSTCNDANGACEMLPT